MKITHSKFSYKTKTDHYDKILHRTDIELKEKEECKKLKIKRTKMKDKIEFYNKKEQLIHYKAYSMKSKREVKRNNDSTDSSSNMLWKDNEDKILYIRKAKKI